MNTLNDKRLEKANNSKEKKKRIKEHRDDLNSNDHGDMERAWNRYIDIFWKWWKDRVLVDACWYVNRLRSDRELELEYILDRNCTMWLYGSTKEKLQQRFFEITEELFNS